MSTVKNIVERYDEPGYWSMIENEIIKNTLNGASCMPSSTSATSNLMAARTTEAWAKAASYWNPGVEPVRFWFRQKDELGININEELAKRKIDAQELAKVILGETP